MPMLKLDRALERIKHLLKHYRETIQTKEFSVDGQTNQNSEGKLQVLIEKGAVKAAVLLLALICYMYQSDRANMQANMKALDYQIKANQRAISRLNDGKASREELKSAIQAIAQNNNALKSDMKDAIQVLRDDLVQRLDLINKR